MDDKVYFRCLKCGQKNYSLDSHEWHVTHECSYIEIDRQKKIKEAVVVAILSTISLGACVQYYQDWLIGVIIVMLIFLMWSIKIIIKNLK